MRGLLRVSQEATALVSQRSALESFMRRGSGGGGNRIRPVKEAAATAPAQSFWPRRRGLSSLGAGSLTLAATRSPVAALARRGSAAPRPHFVTAAMERPSVSGVERSYAGQPERGLRRYW